MISLLRTILHLTLSFKALTLGLFGINHDCSKSLSIHVATCVNHHRGSVPVYRLTSSSFKPDVILMDINLPGGMSGFDALEILRNDPSTVHIPVIALSANAIPRDVEKGITAGFFRYLTKSIKVNEFMVALDIALNHAEKIAKHKQAASVDSSPAAT